MTLLLHSAGVSLCAVGAYCRRVITAISWLEHHGLALLLLLPLLLLLLLLILLELEIERYCRFRHYRRMVSKEESDDVNNGKIIQKVRQYLC
jgi:membrane protein YdbS with pleckstrin-like domain